MSVHVVLSDSVVLSNNSAQSLCIVSQLPVKYCVASFLIRTFTTMPWKGAIFMVSLKLGREEIAISKSGSSVVWIDVRDVSIRVESLGTSTAQQPWSFC